MFAKWPILLEKASFECVRAARLTHAVASYLPQFGTPNTHVLWRRFPRLLWVNGGPGTGWAQDSGRRMRWPPKYISARRPPCGRIDTSTFSPPLSSIILTTLLPGYVLIDDLRDGNASLFAHQFEVQQPVLWSVSSRKLPYFSRITGDG